MRNKALIIGILFFIAAGFGLSVPIVNDITALKAAETVRETPLPDETEYIESFSRAGKLVGNGNGMQYLGGILIRSGLPLTELQEYYGSFGYTVEVQAGRNIGVIEHGTLSLSSDACGENLFIVYLWASGTDLFRELDLRGH